MHAQLIAAILAVAGSALGETLPSYSSTSTVTLYPSDSPTESKPPAGNPSCTVCPHPKDYDRNWNSDSVLNDTRKHHRSFKLFAYHKENAEDVEARIPLHLLSRSDKGSPDFWNLKLGFGDADSGKHNHFQSRWNLHDNALQTDKSAPINETLYFRLYDAKYSKDTEFWTGTIYHEISIPHENQKEYKKENNAKLVAKKSWSLVRDNENPLAYILKGSKPDGNFYACADFLSAGTEVPSALGGGETPEFGELLDQNEAAATMVAFLTTGHLVYSASDLEEPFAFGTKKPKGCIPLVIKVRCCPNHGFHDFFFVD